MSLPSLETRHGIFSRMAYAAIGLFINGFGVYLTIQADIGSGPWDVLNLGLSGTFGILYGTASIAVSLSVLLIDILLREPIGIAMLIDTVVVGKSVDFFRWLDVIPSPKTLLGGVLMTLIGLVIIGATQGMYMGAALGCGPRDTLMVGLTKHFKKIPIGVIGIIIQGLVTVIGWNLGGKVGIGTVMVAFLAGPIMQLCFKAEHFDATGIVHQNILTTFRIFIIRHKAHKKSTVKTH